MANTSISGLVSGLDTSTIISQLMQLEARPQTMLKSKVSNEQKIITALQAFNTKLAAIATKAGELAKASGWTPSKATSTNDKVTVTTGSAAAPGSISLGVVQLATASQTLYSNASAAGIAGASAANITIDFADAGKADLSIAVGNGSLQAIADGINGHATAGLKATLVRAGGTDAAPTYQLMVSSATTGNGTGFTIDDGSGNFLGGTVSSTTGVNAQVKLGGEATAREFTSNTITGLMPGVDVTLEAGAAGTMATITVERDVTSLAESVKAMVDSVNAALNEIGTLTAYDASAKKAGLLAGDSTLRTVRNQLLESVSRGIDMGTGTESLASLGIQTDRSGKLVFDEVKFKAAYAADPTGTTNKIAGTTDSAGNPVIIGLADKLKTLGEAFSSSSTGTVSKAIQSRQSAIRGWEDDIADWDIRLAARQTTLQRQYTALESALGKLQSQGNWLAGQIASLPQMSSGS